MFKRLIWFGSGAVSGAAGGWYVKRRIQEKLRRFTPGGVREQAVVRAKRAQADAKIALTEARRLAKDYKAQNGANPIDAARTGSEGPAPRTDRSAKRSARSERASRPRR